MHVLKLSTVLFGISALIAVGTVDSLAQQKVPACIAGSCVANGDVRPEAVVEALRLVKKCYLALPKVDWRLVSVDLSKERVCESPREVARARALGTREGIRIGSLERDVRRIYGTPAGGGAPSDALLASFFGERKVEVDRQLLYDTGRKDDLLSAPIFIRHSDPPRLCVSVARHHRSHENE
jgi:hypothetical protein